MQPNYGPVWPDPHWEWKRVEALGMPERWIAIRCSHLDCEPVTSVTGEHVATLCLTCDTQLPAGGVAP